ncbi:SPP1 family predicted phage head-tail adaptor [Variovorax boronicumulans]|uniref:phage head closure protein n=1 Tax=Variovorax boronicumulans TaxID=436515 RepID=UPI00277E2AD1|nr:phage head closure protein [Variovorax boronicumulans]MDQ0035927.1 SPP1 family predicted phage head-tail adaptor [Variovorax boronicumulans]
MTLAAGTLNRRVKLQRLVETQDPDTGAVVKTWQDVATVWANVRYLNGVETLKADTTISAAKVSIRIRFREDVVAKWRVVYALINFNILAVLPDAQGREYVDLACDTGANEG